MDSCNTNARVSTKPGELQYPLLRASAFLVPDPSGAVHRISRFPILCMADGVKPDEIEFGELGYAREARASYQDFCAARERGDLPRHVRFQVCLPTPMAVIYAYCSERDVIAVYNAYERDMTREVTAICRVNSWNSFACCGSRQEKFASL